MSKNKNDEKITEFIGKSAFYIVKGIKFTGISIYKVTIGGLKRLRYFRKTDMYLLSVPLISNLLLFRLGLNNIKYIPVISLTTCIISLGCTFLLEKRDF